MNNTVNTTKLAKFRQTRNNRIDVRQAAAKLSNEDRPLAALWVDKHAKKTTNRKMLKKVGYIVEDISEDNFDNVVEALRCIGVTILIRSTRLRAINTLARIIDEEIAECWGGADVREYVEIA